MTPSAASPSPVPSAGLFTGPFAEPSAGSLAGPFAGPATDPSIGPVPRLAALERLADRQVGLLGLGREGWSSYRFLRQFVPGLRLIAADRRPVEELAQDWQQAFENDDQLEYFRLPDQPGPSLDQSGSRSDQPTGHPDRQPPQLEVDLALRTPGMTPATARAAVNSQTAITSNSQLALEIAANLPDVTSIGVTGTKGKTTTTAAIHHLLETAGFSSQLGGNIGTPALDVVGQLLSSDTQAKPDHRRHWLVLELSSHQLADMTISPDMAVVQLVSSEHLDYFTDAAVYQASKKTIAQYQKIEQVIIYNAESAVAAKIAGLSAAGTQLAFASAAAGQAQSSPDYIFSGGERGAREFSVWRQGGGGTAGAPPRDQTGQQVISVPLDQLRTRGAHHLYNLVPAVIIADHYQVAAEVIARGVTSFQPVPHRLELVASLNGAEYYNDSAATTPDAAQAAIETFAGRPLILVLGGSSKGANFSQLVLTAAAAQLRAVILLPPEGEQIWQQLEPLLANKPQADGGIPPHPVISRQPVMEQAFAKIEQYVQPGDVVLLSPACASFSQFDSYQQRGDLFRQEVQKRAGPAPQT